MNANQLMNMVMRVFMRKAVNYGIKSGTKAMSRSDAAGRATPQQDRGQPKQAAPKFDAKRAKQSARMVRRMTRF
ncbi:hypothetical protein [uncultured Shimia sp.]|uniref:hypothetical protein n=1 Tax=uncultured Shimia sp. TaxID=573152 RepID=UPI002601698D|nr:hypothetical protein [uncultured Shimia sp.]